MRYAIRVSFLALILCIAAVSAGCFGGGRIQRSYYVLHGVTISGEAPAPIAGQVRVRNMDAASIYEKFQFVVRRSPFELSYSETDVWAVKPNRMVSDVIAEALSSANQFTSVARELGELRPDFILSGDLHAIEVYVSEDLWYAHLDLVLQLTRFETGENLMTFKFDERKHVPTRTFSTAARALSELLSTALDDVIKQMDGLEVARQLTGKAILSAENGGSEAIDGKKPDADSTEEPDAGPKEPTEAELKEAEERAAPKTADDGTLMVPVEPERVE